MRSSEASWSLLRDGSGGEWGSCTGTNGTAVTYPCSRSVQDFVGGGTSKVPVAVEETLMDEHADARVDDGKCRCPDQAGVDFSHTGDDEE